MANEASCIEKPNIYTRYTISDGFSISKGALLMISNIDLYALPSDAVKAMNAFAGISVEEKTASDGTTEISAALDGVWDILSANKAITTGSMVILSGANMIREADGTALLSGAIIGKALETGTANEVIRVRLGAI